MGAQLALPDELAATTYEVGSIASVDSPSGELDCLVTGGTPGDRAQLAGKPIDLMSGPVPSRVGDPEPLSTVCVDDHGLVVVTLPSLMAGVVPYGSFDPGVPAGFDDHADPVPYGTTPQVSPSSPSATHDDQGQMWVVLVAATTIRAGESLADVQTAGRFELASIAEGQLVPGVVTSTHDLEGVALRDMFEGEQITGDSFGSPAG